MTVFIADFAILIVDDELSVLVYTDLSSTINRWLFRVKVT
jgi:hypothetical protein